jgi:hypothetical protein
VVEVVVVVATLLVRMAVVVLVRHLVAVSSSPA